jgi:ABC-type nitrate/sulfonate/bicarbonate transport system substrate-binding protein
VYFALVCLTFLLLGCRAEPSRPSVVRVAYAPVVLDLPFFLGNDTGLFTRAGVQIDARPFTSANDMINALVAGQVDAVTGVSLVPVLNLEAQHPGRARILLHSRMTADAAYDGIVVKKDSRLMSLADLKGRKIAVYPGTTATNLLKAFLKRHGFEEGSVQIVALPPASHLNALASGTVDALMAYEPTLTAAQVDQGARQLFGSVFVDLQNPSPISVTVVSRQFERDNPKAIESLANAFDDAIREIRKDPNAARKHLNNYTKLSPAVVERVSLIPDTTTSEVDVRSLQGFADVMNAIGEMSAKVDVARMVGPVK